MRTLIALVLALAGLAAALPAAETEKPAAPPLKVHMISGSAEYKSEPSLTAYKEHLEKHFNVACALSLGKDGGSDLPGLEALDSADVLVVFARRMKLPDDQLERIRRWCAAGKPVVGIRTASHAFQGWLAFDKEILGGDYNGHGSGEDAIEVAIEEKAKDHPILAGVRRWTRPGKLYRNPSLAEDATVLLRGAGKSDAQPLAWARTYNKEKDGRAFYTSMGFPHDFENENFRAMLTNALFWTAKRAVEARKEM